MNTVGYFKKLGVEFVGDDVVSTNGRQESFLGNAFAGFINNNWKWHSHWSPTKVVEFAWRDIQASPPPKFKYELDIANNAWRPMLEQDKPKTAFTQPMADTVDFPPVGSMVRINNSAGYELSSLGRGFVGVDCTVLATFVNGGGVKMAAVEIDGGDCCCFRLDMCKPIKSQRDKAIDEFGSDIDDVWSGKTETELAEELLSIGYRKLTLSQAKMYDDKTDFFGEQI